VLKAIDEGVRGISIGIDRLNRAANRIAREGAEGDIAGNFVELIKARAEVRANVASVRVADETFATVIDILA
jgi:hypothetical protein